MDVGSNGSRLLTTFLMELELIHHMIHQVYTNVRRLRIALKIKYLENNVGYSNVHKYKLLENAANDTNGLQKKRKR
uniref:Uncharacterized protein n=1 Tax=Anguilla anguilla TaxID=7936 RepID=A0A0E9PQC0_ANGAN